MLDLLQNRLHVYTIVYLQSRAIVRFFWDTDKNRINRAKHGVSFETALKVFEDPRALSQLERIVEGEERWQTVGLVGGVVVLLVVHTWHDEQRHDEQGDESVRIISARKATRTERRAYEEGRFDT